MKSFMQIIKFFLFNYFIFYGQFLSAAINEQSENKFDQLEWTYKLWFADCNEFSADEIALTEHWTKILIDAIKDYNIEQFNVALNQYANIFESDYSFCRVNDIKRDDIVSGLIARYIQCKEPSNKKLLRAMLKSVFTRILNSKLGELYKSPDGYTLLHLTVLADDLELFELLNNTLSDQEILALINSSVSCADNAITLAFVNNKLWLFKAMLKKVPIENHQKKIDDCLLRAENISLINIALSCGANIDAYRSDDNRRLLNITPDMNSKFFLILVGADIQDGFAYDKPLETGEMEAIEFVVQLRDALKSKNFEHPYVNIMSEFDDKLLAQISNCSTKLSLEIYEKIARNCNNIMGGYGKSQIKQAINDKDVAKLCELLNKDMIVKNLTNQHWNEILKYIYAFLQTNMQKVDLLIIKEMGSKIIRTLMNIKSQSVYQKNRPTLLSYALLFDDQNLIDEVITYYHAIVKESSSYQEMLCVEKMPIKDILQYDGIYTNGLSVPSSSALHIAAEKGCMRIIELLLNKYNVNKGDINGYTPLHYAAAHNRVEAMDFLLKNNADINVKYSAPTDLSDWDVQEQSIMHLVASVGAIDALKYLLTRELDVDIKDKRGNTPFLCAALYNHVIVMQILFDHNSNIFMKTGGNKKTALHLSVLNLCGLTADFVRRISNRRGDIKKSILWLIQQGFFVDVLTKVNKETPLYLAIKNYNLEAVRMLLDLGANAQILDPNSNTALEICQQKLKSYRACYDGNLEYEYDVLSKIEKTLKQYQALKLTIETEEHESDLKNKRDVLRIERTDAVNQQDKNRIQRKIEEYKAKIFYIKHMRNAIYTQYESPQKRRTQSLVNTCLFYLLENFFQNDDRLLIDELKNKKQSNMLPALTKDRLRDYFTSSFVQQIEGQ